MSLVMVTSTVRSHLVSLRHKGLLDWFIEDYIHYWKIAEENMGFFDKLKNVEGKIKPKREGKFDNITYLMQDAKSLENSGKLDEAVKLYKEVLLILQNIAGVDISTPAFLP